MTKTSGVPGSAKYVKTSTEKKLIKKPVFSPKKDELLNPIPERRRHPQTALTPGGEMMQGFKRQRCFPNIFTKRAFLFYKLLLFVSGGWLAATPAAPAPT